MAVCVFPPQMCGWIMCIREERPMRASRPAAAWFSAGLSCAVRRVSPPHRLRCAARVSAASPVLAAVRTADSPRGILMGHAAFDRSFCVAADSEQDAVRLLTPQTIGFLTAFDRSVEGQLLSLCWRENTFSLALETDYAFAAVAGSVDLRDLDAVRRSYVRSLQEMCCVLDQLKASPALTGAAE